MADKRKSGDGFDLAPGAAKKLKVDELRAALEARGLDTEGLKATLLERLEAAVAAEEAAGAGEVAAEAAAELDTAGAGEAAAAATAEPAVELASPDGKGEPRLPLILSPEPSALPLPSKAAGFRWADLASPASTAGDATPLPESVGAGNAAASAAVGPMAFIAEEAPAAASDLEAPVEGLVEVTVAVPAAQAGSLPTPLVTLQAATGCTAVSARQDPELPNDVLVVLQGPFQAVHAAVAAVLAAVNPQHAAGAPGSLRLLVTRDDASGIIGKQGSAIAEIRAALGAAAGPGLNVQAAFQVDTQRGPAPMVQVAGPMATLLLAHEEVQRRIRQQFRRQPAGSCTAAAGGGGGGNDSSAAFGESACFAAESAALGGLLGRGGTRVKAIRELSGARVSVEKKETEPHRTSRTVTVSGSAEQRNLAVFLSSLALCNGNLPAGYCHANGTPADPAQAAQAWATLEATALAFESTASAAAHPPANASACGAPGSAWGADRYLAAAGGYSASAAAVYGLPSGQSASQAPTFGPGGGKYKVSLCKNFKSAAGCRFGDRCDFAHGDDELQAAKAGQLPQQLRRTQGMFAASGAPVASGQAAYPPPAAHAHAHASRAPAAAAQKSMVIEVAMSQLGALMGKGGAKIAEIRTASLAKVSVEGRDVEPERQMRRVTITGSADSLQWAHYLIGQALESDSRGGQLPPQAAAAFAGHRATPQQQPHVFQQPQQQQGYAAQQQPGYAPQPQAIAYPQQPHQQQQQVYQQQQQAYQQQQQHQQQYLQQQQPKSAQQPTADQLYAQFMAGLTQEQQQQLQQQHRQQPAPAPQQQPAPLTPDEQYAQFMASMGPQGAASAATDQQPQPTFDVYGQPTRR